MKTCMVPPARLADWPGLAGFKRDRCSYKVSRNLFTDTEVREYRTRAAMLKACDKSERNAGLGDPRERPLEKP